MKNNRIKELRNSKNLTLQETAKAVGINFTTLSKYETGVVKTGKIEMWEKLANLFNVKTGYLMGFEDENR